MYKSFIDLNNDVLINELNADIWTKLYELGIKRGLKASSIKVYLSKIKQLIKEYDSTIQVPEMLKIKNVLKPLVYMDMKDVEKIDIENNYLRLFYIQANTGLAFVDVQKIVIDADIKPYLDNYILTVKREKTNQVSIIPITKKVKDLLALVLMEKKIKYHAYYCNIRTLLGKHITTHVARKTYAMHLLNKGMSIESVSRVLGHSSINTTQKYYVRVTEERIMNEFVKLAS